MFRCSPRFLFCAAAALLLAGCSANRPKPPASSPARKSNSPPNKCNPAFADGGLFKQHQVEGVFVFRAAHSNCSRSTDAALARTPFRPQSTFKLPHALIGLQTGVIRGPEHLWKWDGKPCRMAIWDRDFDLGGALAASCVPCFQDVARRLGRKRLQAHLASFGYGNGKVEGPIDRFWLNGSLRITPVGQLDFLQKMLTGGLNIEQKHIPAVWHSLRIKGTGDVTMYGKTGLGMQAGRGIGWLVGYAERQGTRVYYASLLLGSQQEGEEGMRRLIPLRKTITTQLVKKAVGEPLTLSPSNIQIGGRPTR